MKKGEPWGLPAPGGPDAVVRGGDRDLAAWVGTHPGGLVRFVPAGHSDLAAAVGLRAGSETPTAGTELPMDVLAIHDGTLAVNMVVLGTPPDRLGRFSRGVDARVLADGAVWFEGSLTTLVVAVGQWFHGIDLVPRGHPGDGRVELQAYRLNASERRAMRRRLGAGDHLPHPRILTRSARSVEVVAARPLAVAADGASFPARDGLRLEVRPRAYRLLV
jgi:YegS C-terminal NAD kinase beta sandwich-like domain